MELLPQYVYENINKYGNSALPVKLTKQYGFSKIIKEIYKKTKIKVTIRESRYQNRNIYDIPFDTQYFIAERVY